ncbi:MAG TPA: VTT domain-containing protein [Burkholderiaceae bacterium]|nr:VTT domain-containing protein [Burkholderiaceae bacterium]
MTRLARLGAVLAFLVLVAVLVQVTGLREHLDLAFVRAQFQGHVVQGLFLFALLFSLGNLIQVPGWIFLGAAVLALGRAWGGVAALAAAIVSACVSFALLRLLGGDSLRELPGRWAARIFAQLDAHPVRSVALLRLVLGTAPPLNVALALSGVRFRHYLLGTLIGLPLPIAAYALFFDAAARLFHWDLGSH